MKNIIIAFIEIISIFIVHLIIKNIYVDSYFEWIILGFLVFTIISIFVLIINTIMFRNVSIKLYKKILKKG